MAMFGMEAEVFTEMWQILVIFIMLFQTLVLMFIYWDVKGIRKLGITAPKQLVKQPEPVAKQEEPVEQKEPQKEPETPRNPPRQPYKSAFEGARPVDEEPETKKDEEEWGEM